MNPMRAVALSVLLLLPSACGELLPGRGPAPNLYTLSPARLFPETMPKSARSIAIEEPTATSGIDTNRVAILPSPNEFKYVADTRWVERSPRLVQELILQSFEASGRFASVERQTVGQRVDVALRSELRDFQAEVFNRARQPTIHVRLNAKLVRQPRQDVLASRDFTARVVATTTQPIDVVRAFDQALRQVLVETVGWAAAMP